MSKGKKILLAIIALIVVVAVGLFIFMPTVLLKPSKQTQDWLKENNVLITPGIFYLSNDTLNELIQVSYDVGNSNPVKESHQQLEYLSKRGKGALVNERVLFDLNMASSIDTEAWENAQNSVWEFEQTGGTVAVSGGGDSVKIDGAYEKWDGKTQQKGYKIY